MLKVASGLAGVGSLIYQGTWNASTNVPFLQSGIGTKGYYYLVSVAGTTNLDGINNWQVNDWAVFDGTVWEKVDNNNAVISVNGKTGVVVLTAADVGATPNTTYVIAGTGLSGGGQLTGNVTLNVANTTVTAGTYGNAGAVSQITVNAQGQITNAANVGITIPVANVTGAVPNTVNVIAGTGMSGGGALTGNVTLNLANTAVTAGSYGNAATVGTFTVDAQGRLTAASNATISIPSSAINTTIPNSGLANSSITINGTSINLGGSGTITANTTGTLTLGTGLTGTSFNGSANVTANLANTTVTAGSYGNASTVGTFTVDAQGRLTAAANSSIAINVSAVSGAVPNTVNVIAGTGLSGGGALTGNVTLNVTANSVNQKVSVQNNGVAVGSEPAINFIPGTNITITTADDVANSRANVTIATSGLGTMATQNANAVAITGGTIQGVSLTLDSLDSTPIGNTTPSTAKFTTLNASGNITTGAYTGYLYGNGSGANVTASTTIPNAGLANSTTTLGNATLTLGSTTTTVGNLTLQNANITSVAATFPNSYLANSSVTIGNTSVSLGSTQTTFGNVVLQNANITSVAATFPNSYLANSSTTLGNATLTLGSTTSTVGNLTLQNVTISSVSTPITAAQGGTGLTSLTANNVILGNGTGTVQVVAPGTSGNVLTSNGTTWISQAAAAGSQLTITATSSNATFYIATANATSGNATTEYVNSSIFMNPSLGTLTSPQLSASNGIVVNNRTIASSYTIPIGYSGMSAGPITVSSGITVTVPSGSKWVVL